jgi:hypothetical protein
MNLVILDGRISSMIERVSDPRRLRARFTVTTPGGEVVGVEVRGTGADRLSSEWETGDGVHVRGRVTAAGFVAADFIRRDRPKCERRAVERFAIPTFIGANRHGALQTAFPFWPHSTTVNGSEPSSAAA